MKLINQWASDISDYIGLGSINIDHCGNGHYKYYAELYRSH